MKSFWPPYPTMKKAKSSSMVWIQSYKKNFDVDQVSQAMVSAYDDDYTDDEIKSLLQFYGSPLGQKFAAESPKISREVQETTPRTALEKPCGALCKRRKSRIPPRDMAPGSTILPRRVGSSGVVRSKTRLGAAAQRTQALSFRLTLKSIRWFS